ncbi:MAG: hypothetical protein B6A08_09995 [Sorangiineae bacterium NIC37A_2]|nr:MAG: hypothetical protein B6A08_09995 [Sorangiineae bacterium NIC37A_2]
MAFLSPLSACSENAGPEGQSGGAPGAGGFAAGGAIGSGGLGAGGSSGGAPGAGGLVTGGSETGGAGVGGLGVGGSSGGAPGTGGDEGTGGGTQYPPNFATIREIVANSLQLSEGCGSGSCHGGEATPEFRDNEHLHDDLINPAKVASDYCGGLPLVTPGNPDMSAFYKVISEGCGDIGRMPRACDPDPLYGNCLPEAAIEAVRQWILAGAPAG